MLIFDLGLFLYDLFSWFVDLLGVLLCFLLWFGCCVFIAFVLAGFV